MQKHPSAHILSPWDLLTPEGATRKIVARVVTQEGQLGWGVVIDGRWCWHPGFHLYAGELIELRVEFVSVNMWPRPFIFVRKLEEPTPQSRPEQPALRLVR